MSACPLIDLSRNPSSPAAFIPTFLDLFHSLFICQAQMVLSLSPLPLSSIVSLSFTCLPLAFLLKVAHYHFPLLYTWAFHFGQSQNVLNCICTQSTAFIMHYISSPLSPTTIEHFFLLCSDGLIGFSHTEKRCSHLRSHLELLNRYMGM